MNLDVDPGHLVVLQGPAGSGRTSLLLTLAGRMAATDGFARVGNLPLPRQMAKVQRIAALGVVAGVSHLDPALTVREHIRERLLLHGRLARRSRVMDALEDCGLDAAPHTLVRELDPLHRQRLGVAVALIGSPRVVLIDDVDDGLSATAQRELWNALREVSRRRGVTVVATCHEPGPADGLADAAVHLPGTAPPAAALPAPTQSAPAPPALIQPPAAAPAVVSSPPAVLAPAASAPIPPVPIPPAAAPRALGPLPPAAAPPAPIPPAAAPPALGPLPPAADPSATAPSRAVAPATGTTEVPDAHA